MKNSNFKLIFVIFFIACAVLAVMVFAGVIKIGNKSKTATLTGNVTLWGTVDGTALSPLIEKFNNISKTYGIIYIQKSPETFDQDLLEALAEGKGPDLFFLPDSLALSYANKIYAVPYANYSPLNFKNYNAAAGEVFLSSKGVIALPLSIDPLVMYYNRSILDANGIVYPPKYWDEFNADVAKITKKDQANQIIKSAVGLGQYANVNNAKEIVTSLFMQMGNPITKEDQGGALRSTLGETEEATALGNALSFYTSFANPAVPTYSWNRTFPNSQDAFSSESVAFYFGFASELPTLINKNPNQNMGVAELPQIKGNSTKATRGRVTGIAVSAFTKNFNTAYTAANLLTSGTFAKEYAYLTGLAPARRDLLAETPEGLYWPIFYSSGIFARSWLDPSPKDTNSIFRVMIESVLSNGVKPKDAVIDAASRINLLLGK